MSNVQVIADVSANLILWFWDEEIQQNIIIICFEHWYASGFMMLFQACVIYVIRAMHHQMKSEISAGCFTVRGEERAEEVVMVTEKMDTGV